MEDHKDVTRQTGKSFVDTGLHGFSRIGAEPAKSTDYGVRF